MHFMDETIFCKIRIIYTYKYLLNPRDQDETEEIVNSLLLFGKKIGKSCILKVLNLEKSYHLALTKKNVFHGSFD